MPDPTSAEAITELRAISAGFADLQGRLRDAAGLSKQKSIACRKIGDAEGASVASQIADDCVEAAWLLNKLNALPDLLDQLKAAQARVGVLEAENAALRQRAATSIQWAGGQSPITCGSGAVQGSAQ
jgi:hypothetical protein